MKTFTKAVVALTAAVALTLSGASAANAGKPSSANIQIEYEYTDPFVAHTPGTFAVVNYTVDNHWLCVTYTANGTFFRSLPFHLDGLHGPYPGSAPGHPLTGPIAVDPGTTVYLYAATANTCGKSKIDTLRVPR